MEKPGPVANALPELAQMLVDNKLARTKSEARRMIQQGAVKIDGMKVTDPFAKIFYDADGSLNIKTRDKNEKLNRHDYRRTR